ncbi:MAG: DUF3224 domain-containing protein [Solirubrobacterales bacterium]
MNASAPFTNYRYDEESYAEAEGTELSRVHISRTFTGDLEGEGTAEIMIAKSEGGGGYVGHDRIAGTLGGRTGTFVLQHGGIMGPAGISNTGTIVPGTGTGELEGISGEGTMLADEEGNHTLTLSYDLGD